MKTDLLTAEFPVKDLAVAFAIDPRTLRRRLSADGHDDATATVRRVYQCLSGDGSLESLRKSRKNLQDRQTELAERDIMERDGELVDLNDFLAAVSPRILEVVRIIESAKGLTDDEKRDIRAELAAVMETSTPPTKP